MNTPSWSLVNLQACCKNLLPLFTLAMGPAPLPSALIPWPVVSWLFHFPTSVHSTEYVSASAQASLNRHAWAEALWHHFRGFSVCPSCQGFPGWELIWSDSATRHVLAEANQCPGLSLLSACWPECCGFPSTPNPASPWFSWPLGQWLVSPAPNTMLLYSCRRHPVHFREESKNKLIATVWRVLGKPLSTPTTKLQIILVIRLCLKPPHICEVANWSSGDLRQSFLLPN